MEQPVEASLSISAFHPWKNRYKELVFRLLQSKNFSNILPRFTKKKNPKHSHASNVVEIKQQNQTYGFPGFLSLVWECRKWR